MQLVIQTGSRAGTTHEVDRELSVGRAPDNDIVLEEGDVSGHHARLRPVPGGVEVQDVGSRNGTYINEAMLTQPGIARPGDRIRFASAGASIAGSAAEDEGATMVAPSRVVPPPDPDATFVTGAHPPAPPAPAPVDPVEAAFEALAAQEPPPPRLYPQTPPTAVEPDPDATTPRPRGDAPVESLVIGAVSAAVPEPDSDATMVVRGTGVQPPAPPAAPPPPVFAAPPPPPPVFAPPPPAEPPPPRTPVGQAIVPPAPQGTGFAAPPAAHTGTDRLLVRAGRDAGQELRMEPGRVYTLGRDAVCDLRLSDPRVSNRHAHAWLDGIGAVIEDLGSANHTLIDGVAIKAPARLAEGQEIQVGETVLTYTQRTSFDWVNAPTPTIVGGVLGDAGIERAIEAHVQREVDEAVQEAVERNERKRGRSGKFAGIAAGVALLAGGGALAGVLLTRGGDDTPSNPVPAVTKKNAPATVRIDVFDDDDEIFSGGSGSVIDLKRGLIITNHHVSGTGRSRIFNDELGEDLVDAETIALAPCEDLALLEVDPDDIDKLKQVEFGDSTKIEVGEEVIAMGYPASAESRSGQTADSLSVTAGVISKTKTTYTSRGEDVELTNMIQHTASVNPGNSGGPLFDVRGRQIGINTRIFFAGDRGRAEGENYSIAWERVEELLEDMRDGVSPKWAGFSPITLTNQQGQPVGVGAEYVFPNSAAARAGFKALNRDGSAATGSTAIVAIDGEQVRNVVDYCELMPDEGEVTFSIRELNTSRAGRDVKVRVGGN